MKTTKGIKTLAGWALIGLATTSTLGGCLAYEADGLDEQSLILFRA